MARKHIPPIKNRAFIAIPPGETILEIIEDRGWSQVELARRMDRPASAINEIIKGKKTITAETAIELEYVLGMPASFWLRLEASCQETKVRLARKEKEAKEIERAKAFPYAEMVRHGLVPKTSVWRERLEHILRYLGTPSLDALENNRQPVFRKSDKFKLNHKKLAVWLRRGELRLEQLELPDYDEKKLRAALPRLRELTLAPAESIAAELTKIGAEVGVAFLLIPRLKGLAVNGVTYWRNGIPVVQVNLRHKKNDHFWFTLFHEIGHILLHGRREQFIEVDKGENGKQEKEADLFASEILIPAKVFEEFIEADLIAARTVTAFAKQQGVHPGIVVGRLQHTKKLPWDRLNNLKITYNWADSA